MKKGIVLLILIYFLVSCGASKPTRIYHKTKSTTNRNLKSKFENKGTDKQIAKIISDAESYIGTPYKLGGMTSSGFDCSGFVVKVFNENDLKMPRRSIDQSQQGKKININDVKIGDLLFFATAGKGRVSHVGIVHSILNGGEVKFIHASTTRGVIISSLNESYWNKAFLFARRVL
ncbi:MAG: NlpC/P60 family protein [Flavobacteriaceae bacterium]|nr:NlpC/P60 family protein [Flavobacteriaceae bacterium]